MSNVPAIKEERYTLYVSECGCSRSEIVQVDVDGVTVGNRIEERYCPLGQRIYLMLQRAGEMLATSKTHAGFLRWNELYHQRYDMLDAHTGERYGSAWFTTNGKD